MAEVGVQDDSKRREEAEQEDDDSIFSENVEKVELQDEDSFEVISISCNDSKYSTSGDSDEEDALIISMNNSMCKPFPEVQLPSDLVKSTSSSITLLPQNNTSDDKCTSPKVGLISEVGCESNPDAAVFALISQRDPASSMVLKKEPPESPVLNMELTLPVVGLTSEVGCGSYPDDAVSAAFAEDDQTSYMVLVKELPETNEPVLNVEHPSPSVPSQSIQEHHYSSQSQLQLEESENQNFHGKPSSIVSNPAAVLEKTSTSAWGTHSAKGDSNAGAMVEPHDGSNFQSNPQEFHSIFVSEQCTSHAQACESTPGIQAKGSDVKKVDRKDSSAKMVLSVSHLPKVQNSTAGLWEWLCPKNLLHKLINKAWATVDAVINTLDPQMKSGKCLKPDFEVVIATTCDFEAWPIRKALRKMFFEKVGIANISVTLGCVPAQPVGFESGLCCAERRIKFMREHRLVDSSKIIVATSPVLVEVTPLRWHHTTCLMLDDPHLGLTLHTFTQTVPVPNIYVNQAELRTPSDYHLKHLGFNITVGRVICIMTGMPENDWQYAMTGTSFNKILESAAVVLVGMYKSYLSGISY